MTHPFLTRLSTVLHVPGSLDTCQAKRMRSWQAMTSRPMARNRGVRELAGRTATGCPKASRSNNASLHPRFHAIERRMRTACPAPRHPDLIVGVDYDSIHTTGWHVATLQL